MKSETARSYRRIHGFECSEVPDGYVIYDNSREYVHFLNLTAAAIFELCDERSSIDTIAEIFQNAFDLPATPKNEIEACLMSLISQGLIEPCGRSGSVAA